MRKRIAYSQNFLKDKGLIRKLVEQSSISKEDIVYEIGAGQGVITEELAKKCKKVVAFEIDNNLFVKLQQHFQSNKFVEHNLGNFLSYPLPSFSYKVFSNIPFNITSAVIKKLTEVGNTPEDSYLIVQKEASKKFIGKPYDFKNSQMAILIKPWFDLKIVYEFKKDDFFPKPQVDTVLMRIEKLKNPLVDNDNKSKYQDFVVYVFNQFKPNIIEGLSGVLAKQEMLSLAKSAGFSPNSKPSELDFKQWLTLFKYFIDKSVNKGLVSGSYAKLLQQQSKLEKINRTRVDKNWKQFKRK